MYPQTWARTRMRTGRARRKQTSSGLPLGQGEPVGARRRGGKRALGGETGERGLVVDQAFRWTSASRMTCVALSNVLCGGAARQLTGRTAVVRPLRSDPGFSLGSPCSSNLMRGFGAHTRVNYMIGKQSGTRWGTRCAGQTGGTYAGVILGSRTCLH